MNFSGNKLVNKLIENIGKLQNYLDNLEHEKNQELREYESNKYNYEELIKAINVKIEELEE